MADAITYQLVLDDRLAGVLARTQDRVHSFTRTAVAMGASLLGAQAGLISLQGVAQKFFATFDRGAELIRTSRFLATTVRDVVQLRAVFRDANVETGNATSAIFSMQRALGGVNAAGLPTKRIFDQIGVSIESLRGKSAVEQLRMIRDGLNSLQSAEARANAAQQIFGRGAREMLAIFADTGALDRSARAAEAQAALYQKNAERFARVENAVGRAKEKVDLFFASIAAKAAPVLEVFANRLAAIEAIDFRGVQELADAVLVLVSNMAALASVASGVLGMLSSVLGGAEVLTQALLALGFALLAIKIAQFIASLGQKVLALARSTFAIKAETAALAENTAAQVRNAAARAAGNASAAGGIPAGLSRRDLKATGGSLVVYRAGRFAPAAPAPAAAAGSNIAGAAGVGLGIGVLAQAGMLAYIAHLERAAAATESFAAESQGALSVLRAQSREVGSVQEKEKLLADVRERLAEIPSLRAEAGDDAQKINHVNLLAASYQQLEEKLKSLSTHELTLKKISADYARQMQEEEAAALEELIELTEELARSRKDLKRATEDFAFDQASLAGKQGIVEGNERKAIDFLRGRGVTGNTVEEIARNAEAQARKVEDAAAGRSTAEQARGAKEATEIRDKAAEVLELESKRRDIAKEIAEQNKPEESSAAAASASINPRSTIPAIASDALSRIGGFVGPIGVGAASSDSKRSADTLDKILSELKQQNRPTLPSDDR